MVKAPISSGRHVWPTMESLGSFKTCLLMTVCLFSAKQLHTASTWQNHDKWPMSSHKTWHQTYTECHWWLMTWCDTYLSNIPIHTLQWSSWTLTNVVAQGFGLIKNTLQPKLSHCNWESYGWSGIWMCVFPRPTKCVVDSYVPSCDCDH